MGKLSAGSMAAAARALEERPGVVAAIQGDSSLLVMLDSDRSIDIEQAIEEASKLPPPLSGRHHRIPLRIEAEDAPDLDLVLRQCGLDREAWLEELQQLRLRVRFLGFRAGFAYLEGLPASWRLPRRDTPRPRVAAGSFAIAGERAGFYPVDSPGGWNVIGRTDAELWDPWRDPPSLFSPNDEIEIVVVNELGPTPRPRREEATGEELAEVRSAGQQTLIAGPADQRRLRRGLAAGGRFDEAAAACANAAVGNPASAAVLECFLLGPELEAHTDLLVSWVGSTASLEIDGRAVVSPLQFAVPAGSILSVGRLKGSRGWMAIRRGLASPAPPFAMAPWKVEKGEILRGAGAPLSVPHVRPMLLMRPEKLMARRGPFLPGPEVERWISQSIWRVERDSDRTGVRLRSGPPPVAAPPLLFSTPLLPGALQWTPGGELVVMGPDHPITGGYLHVATVTDLAALARLAPGDEVRIVLT
jgi:KipI family sensor histidine kinase inhibitor